MPVAGSKAATLASALLVGSCLAAACTPAEETGALADSDEPVTMTVLFPGSEMIFNPIWDMPAKFLLFLPMLTFDDEGEYVPSLARTWEHSEDYRTWTFHLRTDVLWHDGVPVSAHDVKFSMELMSRPDIGYFRMQSAAVVDDSTITIVSERPTGLDWWTVFYPKHLLEDLDPAEFFRWSFWTDPVGNGPFRYVRHEPDTMWEMEANPVYWAGKPAIDRLRVKFGGGAVVAELLSGGVDAAAYVSRPDIPRLEAEPELHLHHRVSPEVEWIEGIFWNLRHPLLGDPAVRRALTLAIDRRELGELQHIPVELPLFDGFFTGRQFWTGDLPEPLGYDPEEARRLLDEQGWRDSDADGVRDRDAQPARFTAVIGGSGPSETRSFGQAAVYAQAAFRDVGVEMEIQTQEAGLRERVERGDFDAVFVRLHTLDQNLARWFREDSGPGWTDPAMIELVQAAHYTRDPAEQDSLYAAMYAIMETWLPITLLAPQVQWFAANDRIRGLSSPFRANPLWHAEHLWVEESP